MHSKYFLKKTNSKDFPSRLNDLIASLKNKKVILYGAGKGLEYLKEKFPLLELDIVAIADLKFKEDGKAFGKKAIPPSTIPNYDYDAILITLEYTPPILKFLKNTLSVPNDKIFKIFEDKYTDERDHINYLESIKFEKQLQKLLKKVKGKKVVLYGAGSFFQIINDNYDLSGLNIVAIADRKYIDHAENEEFLGYKVIPPSEIKELNPDYVFVGTRWFINIIEDLSYGVLKDSKIKVRPLIKKPFLELWREIWA